MKYSKFKIKNFKGIEDITIDLDKSPHANIYTFIGLNESGKTTILEAINFFKAHSQDMSVLDMPGSIIKDFNDIIPISKRDNFSDTVSIEVTVKLEDDDLERINEFLRKNTLYVSVKPTDTITFYRKYIFKDSIFQESEHRWTGFLGLHQFFSPNTYNDIKDEDNLKLASLCHELLPSILYFPNFLFDFPTRINLQALSNSKEMFYIDLVQDILCSLDNDTNIQTHLIERIHSSEKSHKRNLDRLIQKMENKITDVVFEAWNRIFNRKIKDTRIIINYDIDDKFQAFLEFEIEAEDGIFQINERSLGFKWFFVFLLFTQFRPYRKNTPKNIIFLFDEPASNLHSLAQQQLLKSFENLTSNSKIIYTTHSHHLINPNWLESTYIVKNEGLNLDDPDSYNIKQTKISIQSYRDFATNHPHNTAYFQPILDVLDYSPSNLENIPNCIFIEGKNDYYVLEYFRKIILKFPHHLNLSPSTGSGNLDTLISLYTGWGREFIILLDSDEAGNKEKERYINKFGIIVEQRIFTLEDINSTWKNFEMESLLNKEELTSFQKTTYSASENYKKVHFNRAIQESLINKKDYVFSEATKENFRLIFDFLNHKINSSL